MDLVLRAAFVFFLILAVTRAVGRRELSSMEPFDLILLVVMGDLVEQGVTQSDYSLTGATIVIATLAVLTVVTAYASFRIRALRPLLEGSPIVLVADGEILDRNLRRQRVTTRGAACRGAPAGHRIGRRCQIRDPRDKREDQFPEAGVTPKAMRALTWQGTHDVRVDTVPDPTIQEPPTRSSASRRPALCGSDLHLYEVLGAVHRPRRHPRPRAHGHRRGGRVRGDGHRPRRPRGRPVQHLLRPLLDVRDGLPVAVRDDAGPRVRHRRLAARLHEALRPGGRRAGRAACASRRRTTARSRCPRARPTTASSPLRRAADRLAGGRVRRRARRRHAARPRARPDRRDGVPDRAAPRRRAGHRRRPRPRAARPRARARRRDARPRVARAATSPTPVRELTGGRGPDAVIDAVGMEAHGAPVGQAGAARSSALLPDAIAAADDARRPAIDRLSALHAAIDARAAAAAPSRSPASTAARSTRCR